jgi:hypothetical protein
MSLTTLQEIAFFSDDVCASHNLLEAAIFLQELLDHCSQCSMVKAK